MRMPVMGGMDATAAIREREAQTGDHVPIIALTADVMRADRDKCIEAGMDGYLSKPIEAEELFKLGFPI